MPLEANDSTVAVLGDETLRDIARELVQTVKKHVSPYGSLDRSDSDFEARGPLDRFVNGAGVPHALSTRPQDCAYLSSSPSPRLGMTHGSCDPSSVP